MRQEVYDQGAVTTTDRPSGGEKFGSSKRNVGNADQAEMMKKAEAAATPGPAHRALDALVGSWKAEVKCWMDAGGAPQTSQATAETSWILDKHFIQEEFHGEMMGKPFNGRSILGYDNTKQTFNSVWVSDMQTSMFTSEGKGENNNKVIALEGKASCAATGRTDVPMKTVFRVISPDKHIFEMFDGSKGAGGKTMEITYTRC
jgi:hypothetical protein